MEENEVVPLSFDNKIVTLSFRLDKDMADAVRKRAQFERKSLSVWIRDALQVALTNEVAPDKKKEEFLEFLKDEKTVEILKNLLQ